MALCWRWIWERSPFVFPTLLTGWLAGFRPAVLSDDLGEAEGLLKPGSDVFERVRRRFASPSVTAL